MNKSATLEVQVSVAKMSRFASSESGDTLEIAERPHGGLSLVLTDGQQDGHGSKEVSNLVARKALSLLAEGIRDGAVARATHDALFAYKNGRIQATLNIVSIDMVSKTVVLSRNSPCPVVMVRGGQVRVLDEQSTALGVHPKTKPVVTEIPIAAELSVVVFTDGVLTAGREYGDGLDVVSFVVSFIETHAFSGLADGRMLADALLDTALSLDRGRPVDDMSVLVVNIVPSRSGAEVRRMQMSFPIPGLETGTAGRGG